MYWIAAKENVPQAHPSVAEQQVSVPPTPLKSSTASSSNSILRYHQKKNRLALYKKKTRASTTSTGATTSTNNYFNHSREQQNLMVTARAIRTSTAIYLDLPDHISFLDNFLFEGDFTD